MNILKLQTINLLIHYSGICMQRQSPKVRPSFVTLTLISATFLPLLSNLNLYPPKFELYFYKHFHTPLF